MQPQAQKQPEPPEAESGEDPPLEASDGVWPCRHLDFGFPAPRTVREEISFILTNQICGDLLRQPQEMNIVICLGTCLFLSESSFCGFQMPSHRRKLRPGKRAEPEPDLRPPEPHPSSRVTVETCRVFCPLEKCRTLIEFSFKAVVENTSFERSPGLVGCSLAVWPWARG